MNEFEASISVSSLETDIFPIFLIRTDKMTDRQTDRQGQVLSRVPRLKTSSYLGTYSSDSEATPNASKGASNY